MMQGTGLKFRLQELGQFFDRGPARQLDPVKRKFLGWSGGELRRVVRRSLKVRRMKVGELSPEQLQRYRQQQAAFRDGRSAVKPQLPKTRAKPGLPPNLQFTPNPLRDGRTGILFSLDRDNEAVVVGPSPFGDNAAEDIEARHPFMEPGLNKIRPRLPAILRRAAA